MTIIHVRACAASLALLVLATSAQSETLPVDAPAYVPGTAKPTAGATYLASNGAIRIGGAEHAKFIVERANALYEKTHPGAKLVDISAGAETAIPMLTFGRVLIGSMGRPIKPLEAAGFARVAGSEPIEIRVAHAANDTSQHLATSLAGPGGIPPRSGARRR